MPPGTQGKPGTLLDDEDGPLASLVVDNLAHVEAASEVVARITAQLSKAADQVVSDFIGETGWDGQFDDLSRWWIAPSEWQGVAALGGVQYARFAFGLTPAVDGDADRYLLSSLTGTGRQRAVLRWEREPAGSSAKFAKFVMRQREMVAQLTDAGFERNHHLGASFHLPIMIGSETLKQAVESGQFKDAVAPIASALRAADAATPLFAPMLAWTREALED